MGLINTAFNALFDLMILPFRAIHPWVGLAVVSIVMSLVALLAFKYGSNATSIARIKTRIGAYLLEMRLFRDDLRVLFLDPIRIMVLNAKYVAHAFGPFLLILPPMLLAMVQIESRYSIHALEPGETTTITVQVGDDVRLASTPMVLETSDGLAIDSPPVRIPREHQVSWRLRAITAGEQQLRIVLGDEVVEKTVWVDTDPKAIARARTAKMAGFAALAEPAEAPLPRNGKIREVRIDYREESRPLGLPTSVWIFFALSTVFGFALKDLVGVTI